MEYKDYYKILDVPRQASAADIKRAYRKLAREFHPDRNKAKGAEDRFKLANEANEVLSDPKKRASYDQLGQNWKNGQRFTPPPEWTQRPANGNGRGGYGGEAGGFSDFFSSLFGGASSNGFDEAGGTFGGSRDQQAKLVISLEESFNGASRNIVVGARTMSVRVPMGVIEGQTVRLAGQSARGGDLLLEISFAPHARFRVEGRDIQSTVSVAPWEAALGGTVPVITLGGTVELNLPAGTASGRRLRLKARGLPATPPGDHFVTVQIVVPQAETEAQRQVYEQMRAQFSDFNPRE